MVELIGDDDQPLNIASLTGAGLTGAAVGYAATDSWREGSGRETLPTYEPMSRIEPGIDDGDIPRYDDDHGAISFDTDSGSSLDHTVVIDKTDVQQKATGHEFVDVLDAGEAIDDATDELEMQPFDANVDEVDKYEVDEYEVEEPEKGDDHGPVTGPVPPRPLGQPTAIGFGDGQLKAGPRRTKKKGSPILMILGVVGGGLLSMPLADAILVYIFNRPPIVGLWPFNETTSEMARSSAVAAPARDIPDERLQPRSNPGDSLAGDLERMRLEQGDDTGLGEADSSDTTTPASSIPQETTGTTDVQEPEMQDLPAAEGAATAGLSMPELPAEDLAPAVTEAPLTETSVALLEDAAPMENAPPVASIAPVVEKPNEPSFDDIVSEGLGAEAKPEASPELLDAIDLTDLALQDVLTLPEATDSKVIKRNKSKLYTSLANVANVPQALSQPETADLLERVSKAGLMKDMTSVAPVWMGLAKRPHNGILLAGKLVDQGGKWAVQWNGPSDVQLENVDGAGIASGEAVFILGAIENKTDAPATVRVVFIQSQGSN
jgi:hypothetical protein